MLEKIINSKTRLSVLSLFFTNKDRVFYAQEIITETGLDPANVHKELSNLAEGEFLTIKKKGSKKFFQLDKKNDFYEALDLLFLRHRERGGREKMVYYRRNAWLLSYDSF